MWGHGAKAGGVAICDWRPDASAKIREYRPHLVFGAEGNRRGRGLTTEVWLTSRGVALPLWA